jgi:hypothetical protein
VTVAIVALVDSEAWKQQQLVERDEREVLTRMIDDRNDAD